MSRHDREPGTPGREPGVRRGGLPPSDMMRAAAIVGSRGYRWRDPARVSADRLDELERLYAPHPPTAPDPTVPDRPGPPPPQPNPATPSPNPGGPR